MGQRGERSGVGRAGWLVLSLALLAASLAPASAGGVTLRPGDIIIADQDAFGGFDGGIIRVDPLTGRQTAVSSNEISSADLFQDPMNLAFDSRGRILVVELDGGGDLSGDGGVIRVDPATGQQTAVSNTAINTGADLFDEPTGIAVERGGRILVADDNSQGLGDTGALIAVNPSSGQQTAVSNNTISPPDLFADPKGLEIDSAGRPLVVDPEGQGVGNFGAVIRVSPSSGLQTSISDQNINTGTDYFSDPEGIGLERSGVILVADPDSLGVGGNGAVIRVNPATGQQTAVSNDDINTGTDLFSEPTDVAVDPSGRILVAETDTPSAPFTGAVIRLSATGQQAALSTNEISGPDLFANPRGIAVFPGLCRSRLATHTGTPGRDVLKGTAAADVFVALGGNDVVRGLGAGDVACGGAGNDRLIGGAGKDLLLGEAGKDRLLGGRGRDRLLGGKGRDRLRGGAARDRLRGGPGPDLQVQ
jgi:hypothetical protein